METRASYVLVGSFVLGLIGAGIFFILWLVGSGGPKDQLVYRVHFTGAVTGLQPAAPVRYRGITMGEVISIDVSETNPDIVVVRIRVDKKTPISTDTIGTLEVQGLTGSPFVQLKRADPTKPRGDDYKPASPREELVIRGESSGLERIFDELPKAVASVTELANRASQLLNEENQKEFAAILKTASRALNSLDELATNTNQAVKNLDGAIKNIESTAKTIDGAATAFGDASRNVGSFAKRTEAAVGEFEKAAGSIAALGKEVQTLVRENRRPLADFASTGLYEFSLFLTDVRKFTRTFDRLLNRFEGDPSNFLFGNRQRGFETPGVRR
jgi:phospholipid/cholesterol/gamma-HCH transport system substrate-binding protein